MLLVIIVLNHTFNLGTHILLPGSCYPEERRQLHSIAIGVSRIPNEEIDIQMWLYESRRGEMLLFRPSELQEGQ